ncbi:hypothetical protein OQA88_9331 [Cercophora sp. LCS_1]
MSSPCDVKELEAALKVVCEKASFQSISAIIERNSTLEKEIAELKTVNQFHDGKFRILQQELENAKKKLDENVKEISHLQGVVKTTEGKIKDLESSLRAEKKISEDRNTIRKQLEAARGDLNAKDTELLKLQSFAPRLAPFPEGNIAAEYQGVYTKAHHLAMTYFGPEYTPEVLRNGSLWKKLRSHKSVQGNFPVPQSNSQAAVLMRVAAFLAVLSSELCDHVFQSTYFLDDADEAGGLSQALSSLARTDPQREVFLRSALLSAIPKDEQELKARTRAETVVDNVCTYVKGFISGTQQKESFRSELEALCRQACGRWQQFQKREMNITASVDLFGHPTWRIFEIELPSSSINQANGVARNSAPLSIGKSPAPELPQTNTVSDRVVSVIWPSIVIAHSGRVVVLDGYGIFDSQTKTVKVEIPGPHRQAREKERMSITVSTANKKGGF